MGENEKEVKGVEESILEILDNKRWMFTAGGDKIVDGGGMIIDGTYFSVFYCMCHIEEKIIDVFENNLGVNR